MKRNILFYKSETSRWYAVLPETSFSKDELEMVMGADVMLDILAQGDDLLRLYLSDEFLENSDVQLDLVREDETVGGGYYALKTLDSFEIEFEVWLCDVTKSVFGRMPKKIYIKR